MDQPHLLQASDGTQIDINTSGWLLIVLNLGQTITDTGRRYFSSSGAYELDKFTAVYRSLLGLPVAVADIDPWSFFKGTNGSTITKWPRQYQVGHEPQIFPPSKESVRTAYQGSLLGVVTQAEPVDPDLAGKVHLILYPLNEDVTAESLLGAYCSAIN